MPIASQRERTSEGDDFPCTFSGLGHASSEGKSREIVLIFCNGTRADIVGVEPQNTPILRLFSQVFRSLECDELGVARAGPLDPFFERGFAG